MLKKLSNLQAISLGLLVACAAFSSVAHAQETPLINASQNLGQNFGFENKMEGWEIITPNGGTGLGVLDTQIKRSEHASLKLSKTNSSG